MKLRELITETGNFDPDSWYMGGSFTCNRQPMKSLEGVPQEILGNFDCTYCGLPTLSGAPREVHGFFDCSRNNLTTLMGAPTEVIGGFFCSNNQLKSLIGVGDYGGAFNCSDNLLTSLEYAPKYVEKMFDCTTNKLTSLHNIHLIFKQINGTFYAMGNPIKSHVLGLLLIKGLDNVEIDNAEVNDILLKYLHTDRKGMIECQNELIEAGYEEYAQL